MKKTHDLNKSQNSNNEAHDLEVKEGKRFPFGCNWTRFLRALNDERIAQAEQSLLEGLGTDGLLGRSFLDIGCGSGLFSLAARRLGARVTSFDYDPQSVACTEYLRHKFFPNDQEWIIMNGSVLDNSFCEKLGHADIVYAWGVLHHTGAMWKAIGNSMELTKVGGTLFMALYNDQGWLSHYWTGLKRFYNRVDWIQKPLLVLHAPFFVGLRWIVRVAKGKREDARGMSLWYDMIDWLGGWPFEVSLPGQVLEFSKKAGFRALRIRTVDRRLGCNEFVLLREEGHTRNSFCD